jgi:hypothetical protein
MNQSIVGQFIVDYCWPSKGIVVDKQKHARARPPATAAANQGSMTQDAGRKSDSDRIAKTTFKDAVCGSIDRV